jgi:hypothetical protein
MKSTTFLLTLFAGQAAASASPTNAPAGAFDFAYDTCLA